MISSSKLKVNERLKDYDGGSEEEELRKSILEKYSSPRDYLLITPEKRTRWDLKNIFG